MDTGTYRVHSMGLLHYVRTCATFQACDQKVRGFDARSVHRQLTQELHLLLQAVKCCCVFVFLDVRLGDSLCCVLFDLARHITLS